MASNYCLTSAVKLCMWHRATFRTGYTSFIGHQTVQALVWFITGWRCHLATSLSVCCWCTTLTNSSSACCTHLSLSLSLSAWPSTGRSARHADRSIATLQASEGESPVLVVTCSIQHFRKRPACLLQFWNCPEPCRDVTERCRAWWAGAVWSIHVTWPRRECHLWTAAVRGWRLPRS